MIVCQLASRIRLITQPDHAHLARRIMERCVSLRDRPRADSILLAIGEHDNGWEEEDASPTVDLETGKVVDFVSAPLAVRHRVWPRAIGRLSARPVGRGARRTACADRVRSVPRRCRLVGVFCRADRLRDAMLDVCQGALADLAVGLPVRPAGRPDLARLLRRLDRAATVWRVGRGRGRTRRQRHSQPLCGRCCVRG